MEVLRTCKLCKVNKSLNNFEPYGRNFRQQCRQCRTSVIGGQTMQLQVVNALQEQTASVTRAEQQVADIKNNIVETRDIISTLSDRYEQQIMSLSDTKDRLLEAISVIHKESLERDKETTNRLIEVSERVEALFVSCGDIKVKEELGVIHNELSKININTKNIDENVKVIYSHAKYIPKANSPRSGATSPQRLTATLGGPHQ